jgi:perosamine synthetase
VKTSIATGRAYILSDVPDGPLTAPVPLCEPELRGNEWLYVKSCLDTKWVSSVGSFVERFERDVASHVGSMHGVATVSGTAALHVALQVAGVGAGDEVVVPSLTFVATANAVRYRGAHPVFIDAEPHHWQIDPGLVATFLVEECEVRDGVLRNRTTDRPVRAILPVHVHGHPCDMDPIVELARRFRLVVIEDATEGLGAEYKKHPVGSLGDVACFSFNGNKMITTGGGGMIVTNNSEWARNARYLTTQAKDDPLEYVHCQVGYNYRLTNVQAAMGCAQMESISEYVAAKRRIAATYSRAFRSVPGLHPQREATWAQSASWMYSVCVDSAEYGLDSRTVLKMLSSKGVQSRPLWQPLHCSPAYPRAQCLGGGVAERLNRDVLSLPCSVGLTETQQTHVIDLVKSFRP